MYRIGWITLVVASAHTGYLVLDTGVHPVKFQETGTANDRYINLGQCITYSYGHLISYSKQPDKCQAKLGPGSRQATLATAIDRVQRATFGLEHSGSRDGGHALLTLTPVAKNVRNTSKTVPC